MLQLIFFIRSGRDVRFVPEMLFDLRFCTSSIVEHSSVRGSYLTYFLEICVIGAVFVSVFVSLRFEEGFLLVWIKV